MNFSAKTKIITLAATGIVAAAVIVWLVLLFNKPNSSDPAAGAFTGTVNSVIPDSAHGGKPGRYFVTVRGDERAYVFEFNPDTVLLDTEGKQQVYYSIQSGQQVKVIPDKSQTAEEPAQFVAKKAEMLTPPRVATQAMSSR